MPCVPDTLILRNYVCCSIAFLAVIKVGSSCACGKVQFMRIDSISFRSTFQEERDSTAMEHLLVIVLLAYHKVLYKSLVNCCLTYHVCSN